MAVFTKEKLKTHLPQLLPMTSSQPNQETSSENKQFVDLSCSFCDLELDNPFVAASGILGGRAGTIRRLQELGAGAVVTKTITAEERLGYPGPTVVEAGEGILLNAMGLPNPGMERFSEELAGLELKIPLVVSLSGKTPEDFVTIARKLAPLAHTLELNISCPHPEPKGKRKILISQDEEASAEVVSAVRKALPYTRLMAKLSPMAVDIKTIVTACLDAGADGVVLINTVPALDINLDFQRPVLGNLIGGQSGPSVLCIAQRKVAEAKAAIENWKASTDRKAALVGCGGIFSGYDAAKFILIGADAIQVGTALKRELGALERMKRELRQFMITKGYQSLDDFRGKAFEHLRNIL